MEEHEMHAEYIDVRTSLIEKLRDCFVARATNKNADQNIIAVGTTSLYGIHSQYNGIPLFKTLGESAGKISLKPDDKFYDPWHQWIKENSNTLALAED